MNLTRRAKRYLRLDFTLEDALPTRMPVYVNSVVYLFGATALMALAWMVISGVVLTLGGPSWYHANAVGRFANAVHFWSVQLFFFGLILHFITKFFLGAWRDRRWLTWVVGLLLLGAGVFTGLTGFLLQTNWDSQWIATQAKDAMNAAGIGAFFNTMDTGQVLTLHVAALPLGIAAVLGLHIFLIRRDSPVRPYDDRPNPANRAGAAKAGAVAADAAGASPTAAAGATEPAGAGRRGRAGSGRRTRENLRGIPLKPYDLLREGVIVFVLAAVVVLALTIFVGAPDYPTVTGENVATKQPIAYLKTTVGILLGNEDSALTGYGPPYQNDDSAAQHLGPIAPATWFGVTRPIDPAQDLVLAPLARVAQINPAYAQPLVEFKAAAPAQKQKWLAAYDKALGAATVSGDTVQLPAGDYGPVEAMMKGMLGLGRAGRRGQRLRALQLRLFAAALVLRRRATLLRHGHAPRAAGQPAVGHRARDRQLPRRLVARWVPGLVRDPGDRGRRQRRPARGDDHARGLRLADAPARDPRPQPAAPRAQDLPRDLARLVP